jgi:hypothetical protein
LNNSLIKNISNGFEVKSTAAKLVVNSDAIFRVRDYNNDGVFAVFDDAIRLFAAQSVLKIDSLNFGNPTNFTI